MAEARLWEVFVRGEQGGAHRHAGSVRASDATMAMHHARDVFTRRGEVVSLWVLPADQLLVSDPNENAVWFDSARDKTCRSAQFYPVPEGVEHL